MIRLRNKKHKIFLTAFILLALVGVLSVFSLRAHAAGTGTIKVNSNIANTTININPGSYTGTVVTANTAVTATTTALAGTYTASCPDKAGYTITDPPSQNLINGGSITFSCTYNLIPVPAAFLKDLGYTTAETLLFTPSAEKPIKQWSLLKGVGEISIANNNMWQKSAAEILYVGTLAQVAITKNGPHYVVAGSTAEYSIRFHAEGTTGSSYVANITDTITVSKDNGVSQDDLVTIEGASVTTTSVTPSCSGVNIPIGWTINPSSFPSTSKTITFNNINAAPGCEFEVILTLKTDASLAPNTVITDKADIVVQGIPASATFITLAVGAFTQETVGGDIYARGALSFGQLPTGQYGGKYVIGADGSIENTTAASKQGWTLGEYGIRSGSTDNFDPENCISGSACKTMNDNIARLMKGKTDIAQNNLNGTFNLNPGGLPEGGVFYKNGDLIIGGPTAFEGKGTIIIENGNLLVNGSMLYDDANSMLGIIVKNGNVVVSGDPSVIALDAIFYIFSDQAAGQKGQFIVNPNLSGADTQLVITGAVIASGYYDGSAVPPVRKDAFVLGRRYAGDPVALEAAAKQFALDGTPIPDSPLAPAELFLYDSRVIVSPPPGFGGKIVAGL